LYGYLSDAYSSLVDDPEVISDISAAIFDIWVKESEEILNSAVTWAEGAVAQEAIERDIRILDEFSDYMHAIGINTAVTPDVWMVMQDSERQYLMQMALGRGTERDFTNIAKYLGKGITTNVLAGLSDDIIDTMIAQAFESKQADAAIMKEQKTVGRGRLFFLQATFPELFSGMRLPGAQGYEYDALRIGSLSQASFQYMIQEALNMQQLAAQGESMMPFFEGGQYSNLTAEELANLPPNVQLLMLQQQMQQGQPNAPRGMFAPTQQRVGL
jgi:hypothetical protein